MSEANVASFPQNEDGSQEIDQTAQKQSQSLEEGTKEVAGVAGKRLLSFIERVERLEEEKTELAEDIKEVYGEAKSVGFDVKAIRSIVKLRKMDIEKRREAEEILETYKAAIGM